MTLVNMDALKQDNPTLHRLVSGYLNIGQTFGDAVDVHLYNDLPVDLTMRLLKWLEQQPKSAPAPAEPQVTMEQIMSEQEQDMRRRGDEAAGKARLNEYVAAQGLLESPYNLEVIQGWLRDNCGSYISLVNVDNAVAACRDILQFTPATPVEAPKVLSDGSWSLPLDADERMMKKASVAALKDLNARRREASQQQYRDGSARFQGNFGAKF